MDLTITINESGNLVLSMDKDSREELKEEIAQRDLLTVMADIMEPYSTNGSYTPFDAGDGNPFVGLTDAPCIAEGMDYLDDGTQQIEGRFWYFANYMLECPMETLAETGEVVFQAVFRPLRVGRWPHPQRAKDGPLAPSGIPTNHTRHHPPHKELP